MVVKNRWTSARFFSSSHIKICVAKQRRRTFEIKEIYGHYLDKIFVLCYNQIERYVHKIESELSAHL